MFQSSSEHIIKIMICSFNQDKYDTLKCHVQITSDIGVRIFNGSCYIASFILETNIAGDLFESFFPPNFIPSFGLIVRITGSRSFSHLGS